MNQEDVKKFVLSRVKDGKEDEAKNAITEFFEKQKKDEINAIYMIGFVPKIVGLLKPEFVDEVKETFAKLAGKLSEMKTSSKDDNKNIKPSTDSQKK